MSAVSIAIVGRQDEPLFLKEYPTKYWSDPDSYHSEEDLFGISSLSSMQDTTTTRRQRREQHGDFGCSLKQQSILHAALDRFMHLVGPPPGFGWRTPGTTGSDAMFVGLLCPVEDYRVYGYMTTTKIKIIAVFEDDDSVHPSDQQTMDDRVKALLVRHWLLYYTKKE
jgi:hypothetical protein